MIFVIFGKKKAFLQAFFFVRYYEKIIDLAQFGYP